MVFLPNCDTAWKRRNGESMTNMEMTNKLKIKVVFLTGAIIVLMIITLIISSCDLLMKNSKKGSEDNKKKKVSDFEL